MPKSLACGQSPFRDKSPAHRKFPSEGPKQELLPWITSTVITRITSPR